ncbi:unnamed protein product [Vicia faba]|uniref:Uncharacterized protein n=1 Tax=Vicia faba TaxID=3906 RepID=A0AAV0ZC90_VICFA|nr:unnamed protein product [Vicia faba]
MKDEELLIQNGSGSEEKYNHMCQCRNSDDTDNIFNKKCRCYRDFHKHNHQITISDVVFKHRWSSVSSSDLMFLNSEMINATSSDRFNKMESNFNDVKHDDGERRSVSEIIGVSRFREFDTKKRVFGDSSLVENDVKEERMRKLWFPIARRTAEWFVNREKSSQQKSFLDV